MFTRRKLSKLIETKEDKEPINCDLLNQAKAQVDWNDVGEVKVVDNRKTSIFISLAVCCIVILLIVGIILGVMLSKPSDDSLVELPIRYSYTEDKMVKCDSIEKYVEDNNIDIKYFAGLTNIDETVTIYNDSDIGVLLEQYIVLLDTYEVVSIYVELQDNYLFDFLNEFDNVQRKQV